ncbi:hypothetical protein KKF84_16560, partial [Myxococcota bacterium]|nr:hypothetical protein [Myxococcota bacterium]
MTTDNTGSAKSFSGKLRNKMLGLVVGSAVVIFLLLMTVTWYEIKAIMVRELKEVASSKVELASESIDQNLKKKMQ